MDETNYRSLANRDSPIPSVSVTGPQGDTSSPGNSERKQGKRDAVKQSLSSSKPKEKLEGLEGHKAESSSLQDRVFTMLLQQIIPSQEGDEQDEPKDRRSRKYVERPGFSLPIMSNNFRRFNARIGVAFVFQNRLIRLFTWRVPTHTLSFLAIYSFICLDPSLLAVAPLAFCLFFIMVPAFLARHPPPPSHTSTELYPLQGPPLAPPQSIKPAADLSKDFFRNMRDLQNSMDDFSRLHDQTVTVLAPPTNFSNEALSSTIFLILFVLSCVMFIAAHLLPWRAIALVSGWAFTCANHPYVVDLLHSTDAEARFENHEAEAKSWLLGWTSKDIDLSGSPEVREVETFELQYRPYRYPAAEYEPFVFGPSPYTLLSPARIAGDKPKGTRFFEDVSPPRGWRWSDKKWTLDLGSREWVEERCITGVEVEMEGERWVYDIDYDEDTPIAEGENGRKRVEGKGKEVIKTWEEGDGTGRRGQWRRRRWVRLVERKSMGEDAANVANVAKAQR
ncbi:Peroxisome size and maintenance regulator [Coniosporium apollinis]|uniref:Peroxisome size and maintenance regulator n=1 Tax=Coniosporium apollinis TaxID=61459 RepID=A0ABQ9NRW0_9PEZI|nr:Peroxisome size and maintenance regulator [Coniosporium apollinis]